MADDVGGQLQRDPLAVLVRDPGLLRQAVVQLLVDTRLPIAEIAFATRAAESSD